MRFLISFCFLRLEIRTSDGYAHSRREVVFVTGHKSHSGQNNPFLYALEDLLETGFGIAPEICREICRVLAPERDSRDVISPAPVFRAGNDWYLIEPCGEITVFWCWDASLGRFRKMRLKDAESHSDSDWKNKTHKPPDLPPWKPLSTPERRGVRSQ